jgi:hypothetical protein
MKEIRDMIRKVLKETFLQEYNSNNVNGKHLVVVDIQPEYENYISFDLFEFIEFINENYDNLSNLTFLYNGYDTIGMIEENEYRSWLLSLGLDERVVYNAKFYDKGYAFFRNCMDQSSVESTIELVKFMYNNDIHDSREIDEEFWNKFINNYKGEEDLNHLKDLSEDAIFIPDVMEELKTYNNIIICGGGVNECLKEIEIALISLGKSYNTLDEFTY